MKCMRKIAALPNLVNATGVETLLRLPSSARFDEFPVHGKSFPLRKTISCSLQVQFSPDRGPASGKCMEAMATVFCKRGNACETCASDAQTCVSSCVIEREVESAGGSRGSACLWSAAEVEMIPSSTAHYNISLKQQSDENTTEPEGLSASASSA